MYAHRIIVKQTVENKCGEHEDKSFVEYTVTLAQAADTVRRMSEPFEGRDVSCIIIESIYIQEDWSDK